MRGQIERVGADLAYIAAEKSDGVFKPAKFLEKNPVSYPFLLDEDRAVTKTYGLYHRIGMDAWNIAYPATLIVDRERVIRFIYRGDGQGDRAPIESIMKILNGLRPSR